jgi:hypothetical protein
VKIILLTTVIFFSCVAYGQTQPATTEQVTELSPAEEIQQPFPVEPQRIDLGRIGVVAAGFRPGVSFDKPMTRRDALGQGALVGAGSWIAAGSRSGGNGLIAGLVLSPVAAVVGSIIGVIKGESEEKIKETEGTLMGFLATVDPQETLRNLVLSLSREQTRYSFIPLALKGPSFLDEEVTYDMSSHQGIDTVLEIGVQRCRLSGGYTREINPDLQLSVAGSIRFISAKDGKLLHLGWVSYDGDSHKFYDWGSDSARLFEDEMYLALHSIAKDIIEMASSLEEHPDTKHSEEMKTE